MLRFVRETDLERIERLKSDITAYLEGRARELVISDQDVVFLLRKAEEQVRYEAEEGECDDDDILPIPNHFEQPQNPFQTDTTGTHAQTTDNGGTF